MAEYRSPHGEVLDIPDNGTDAIEKLGWKPVTPPEPKRPATQKPAPKK